MSNSKIGSATRPLGLSDVTALCAYANWVALGRYNKESSEAYISLVDADHPDSPRVRLDLTGPGLEFGLPDSVALQVRSLDFYGENRLIVGLGGRDKGK